MRMMKYRKIPLDSGVYILCVELENTSPLDLLPIEIVVSVQGSAYIPVSYHAAEIVPYDFYKEVYYSCALRHGVVYHLMYNQKIELITDSRRK